MTDRVGEHLGNYHLLRLLGRGGFASVYLGEHVYLKSLAALKVLHTHLNEEDTAQFMREAQMLAGLSHPHIVRVHDFAVQDGTPFLVMEFAPGGTLRQRHPAGTQLPIDTICGYVQQIASALQYAHDQRLIHRDVKPENMLLNAREEVVLSDFGLAILAPHTLSASTQAMDQVMAGTTPYLAPEQMQGKARPASDQYALGVVVYEWLCGKRPFTGTHIEIAMQHLSASPPSLQEWLPDLSPVIEEVVLRALAKDPGDRFARVQDFAEALNATQSAKLLPSTPPLPTLHISLLGDFLLVSGETPITTVDWPRLQSLLAYLLLHRTAPQSRSAIAYLLWPESTDAQAHTNLRQLVHRLRHTLPHADSFVCIEKQTLQWQLAAPFTLDVADFEREIAWAEEAEQVQDQTAARQALEQAVAVYRGDLLPGCYDEWILPERERLRQLFLGALERLILLLEGEGNYPAAISAAQRLLRHDSLHEATYRHLMRLYAANGDRAAALRMYQTCVAVLERELAVEPASATREAYERLMQKEVPPSLPIASLPVSLTTAPPLSHQSEASSHAERPWNVSYGRNPFFTGRGQVLDRLHEQLLQSKSAALNQSAALSGLGGIGKTQMAIEYAYRYRDEYSAVLWVRADSRETLVADYVAIARLLSLPGHQAQEQMQVVATVNRWLQEQEGWLLILDNADDLSLLPDFLSREGKGHLLLTTRAQATGKLAKSLAVEKMEMAEGMQLLLRRAKLLEEDEPLDTISAAERNAARRLVEELDGLPLALDQAGAYIEETGCSLSDYLALYTRRRLTLLKRKSSIGSDYPHTVASTWALSFSQVEQGDPAAADLLRLCAFLHPDAIPEAMLTEGATELGPRLQEAAADALLLNEAIQLLRRYSLIKRDAGAKLLYIHRLVQVVLKESLDVASQQQWAERTVRAVNAAFPDEEFPSWERCDLLLPHALVCAELIVQHDFSFPEAPQLLHAAGHYLVQRSQFAQAGQFLQQALSIREKILGPEHPETASTLNRLANLYLQSGNYQHAERLVQPALATYERVLGPEHSEVAFALDTLASVYIVTGRYEQAEPLFQRALTIREQVLGPTHPLVAETLNGLAMLYDSQARYAQAESLYQRTLVLCEQALGPEHPNTLTVLNNLASVYLFTARYKQAEALYRRVLTLRERVQGEENGYTIISLLNLGYILILEGQYQQAKVFLQRVHTLSEPVLGFEHTATLKAPLYLAHIAQAQKQDALAESLYQQALAGFEQVRGTTHPSVSETLTGLAQLYMRKGAFVQAEPLLQRALIIYEQAFGPAHPYTATVLGAQGHLAFLQGREEQAEHLLQHALTIQEQALGNAHTDVAQTLHHLAELAEKQGQQEQAQSLYQRTLAIREQVLGADHPDTIATREALAKLSHIAREQDGKGITSQPQTDRSS